MIPTTIEKTIIIPSDDIEILEKLIKERGWKYAYEDYDNKLLQYFINKKTDNPPLSDCEIVEESKRIRHGL